MRAYALLIGTLFTVGYGYVADFAVRSAGFPRAGYSARATTADPPASLPLPIWYGGMLKPITVEAFSLPRPAYTIRALDRLDRAARCTHSSQPVQHAISID